MQLWKHYNAKLLILSLTKQHNEMNGYILTLGVTTGPNSARTISVEFWPILALFCRKKVSIPHTGTNGIIGKLNHSSF